MCSGVTLGRDVVALRGLCIAPLLYGRNRQAFYLSASYFLELVFPALKRASDQEQNQAVPGLTKLAGVCVFHASDISGGANWVFRLLLEGPFEI